MNEGHPVQYILPTPSINYYTIESGSSQFMRDDLFMGRIPKHLVIGLVLTSAYHGKSDENPFNFQHFDVCEIGLYKDSMKL